MMYASQQGGPQFNMQGGMRPSFQGNFPGQPMMGRGMQMGNPYAMMQGAGGGHGRRRPGRRRRHVRPVDVRPAWERAARRWHAARRIAG